ncbi:hypothetical protein ACFWUZ_22100 [Streptomyces sp. NPDC058646]|uniref:hypothetical protein n=1 Tax=Streptomyces sp. NPDC058646 TaxID=3346574 RepID=UPI00366661B2
MNPLPPAPLRPPVQPHAAWYAAPAALVVVALVLAAFGTVTGLFLTAGKRFACDATTSCAKTPYEPGYRDPAWPQLPFTAALVCVALAAVAFAVVLVLRRRVR